LLSFDLSCSVEYESRALYEDAARGRTVTDRRRALIERFRAISLARIARLRLTLGELGQGEVGEVSLREAVRDLHTFNGGAPLIGLGDRSGRGRTAEGLLQRGGAAGGSAGGEGLGRALWKSFDRIGRALGSEEGAWGGGELRRGERAPGVPGAGALGEPLE